MEYDRIYIDIRCTTVVQGEAMFDIDGKKIRTGTLYEYLQHKEALYAALIKAKRAHHSFKTRPTGKDGEPVPIIP